MINFGTTYILFEIFDEPEEKKVNLSTKTKSRGHNIFKHAFLRATRENFKKAWTRKKIKTVGDHSQKPCISLAIYSKEVYIRKQYVIQFLMSDHFLTLHHL